jgi:hypothetical protein
VAGIGSGLSTTHVGPLILGGTLDPPGEVQSVVVLAQSLPLLLANGVLGSLNDLFNVDVVLVVCAVFLLAAAALGLRSPVLRTATLAQAK